MVGVTGEGVFIAMKLICANVKGEDLGVLGMNDMDLINACLMRRQECQIIVILLASQACYKCPIGHLHRSDD